MGGSACVHCVSSHSSVLPSRRHLLVVRIRRVLETHSPTRRPSSPSGRSPSPTHRDWDGWPPRLLSASTRAWRGGGGSRRVAFPGTGFRCVSFSSRARPHNPLDRGTATPAGGVFRLHSV